MDIFWEIHSGLPQEGPGDDDSTERAWRLLPRLSAVPDILDVGCGPGRQTITLARLSGGKVIDPDRHRSR